MTTPTPRDTLTKLLSVLHGWDASPRKNCMPESRSVRIEGENGSGLYRQPGNASFMVLWATGEFPVNARLMARCDATDRFVGFKDTIWGKQTERPLYFAEPLLLPPGCTYCLDSTLPGYLTLHGMFVHHRMYGLDDEGGPVREHPEQFLQRAAELVKALGTLDEILVSAKDVPPPFPVAP